MVVQQNKQLTSIQSSVATLSKLAQKTNAPGNDVFDSKNVPQERNRVSTYHRSFVEQKEKLEKELTLVSQFNHSTKVTQLLAKVDSDMKSMLEEAENIFHYLEDNKTQMAGARMATMDRKFGLLLDSIAALSAHIQDTQVNLLARQESRGGMIGKIELVFMIFIIILVSGVTFYGRRMSKFVEETSRIEEEQRRQIDAQQMTLFQQAKMSALGVMAAGIAHELNNPLAIILARAEQTRKRFVSQEITRDAVVESFEKIESVSKRMAKIIHGIKLSSRQSDEDSIEEANISNMIEETIEVFKERLKNKFIELRLSIPPDITALCRVTQISQVLLNLVNNSIDALELMPQKWIAVELEELNSEIVITVTDSGRGIPAEIASRIMEPFFTTKGIGKGTGLGLSLSRGIMEQHQGSLTLNQKSSNTEFVIRFPSGKIAQRVAA